MENLERLEHLLKSPVQDVLVSDETRADLRNGINSLLGSCKASCAEMLNANSRERILHVASLLWVSYGISYIICNVIIVLIHQLNLNIRQFDESYAMNSFLNNIFLAASLDNHLFPPFLYCTAECYFGTSKCT